MLKGEDSNGAKDGHPSRGPPCPRQQKTRKQRKTRGPNLHEPRQTTAHQINVTTFAYYWFRVFICNVCVLEYRSLQEFTPCFAWVFLSRGYHNSKTNERGSPENRFPKQGLDAGGEEGSRGRRKQRGQARPPSPGLERRSEGVQQFGACRRAGVTGTSLNMAAHGGEPCGQRPARPSHPPLHLSPPLPSSLGPGVCQGAQPAIASRCSALCPRARPAPGGQAVPRGPKQDAPINSAAAMAPRRHVSRSLHSFSSSRQQPWIVLRSLRSTGSQFCSSGVPGTVPALAGVCGTEKPPSAGGTTEGRATTHRCHPGSGVRAPTGGVAASEVTGEAKRRGRCCRQTFISVPGLASRRGAGAEAALEMSVQPGLPRSPGLFPRVFAGPRRPKFESPGHRPLGGSVDCPRRESPRPV